jgi:5-(carboxyamino)imidazole ribonucleotide synthase
MVNFIGGLTADENILSLANSHLHLYDKSPRKGRKVAHATVRTEDDKVFADSLTKLIALAEAVDDS